MGILIAMQSSIFAACKEDWGTCWTGAFREDEVKKARRIPPNVCIVAMTPLGYPAEKKSL